MKGLEPDRTDPDRVHSVRSAVLHFGNFSLRFDLGLDCQTVDRKCRFFFCFGLWEVGPEGGGPLDCRNVGFLDLLTGSANQP